MTTLIQVIEPLLITQSQSRKELQSNEIDIVLAAYRQVISATTTAPPGSPGVGDSYIVASPATGVWEGHEDQIAYYIDGGWRFVPPIVSTIVGVSDTESYVEYTMGSPQGWIVLSIGAGINEFIELNDTPSAYSGQGLKQLRVNAAENAVEFGPKAAVASQSEEFMSGLFGYPANKDYRIVVKAAHAGTITETTTRCGSGTATATFKINTTALGGTANSVSTSEQSQSHSSSNAFSAGDDIVITISSVSAITDMSFTIKYTRVYS